MILILAFLGLFFGLAIFMLAFGLPLYRLLMAKTSVAPRGGDSIITYPLA